MNLGLGIQTLGSPETGSKEPVLKGEILAYSESQTTDLENLTSVSGLAPKEEEFARLLETQSMPAVQDPSAGLLASAQKAASTPALEGLSALLVEEFKALHRGLERRESGESLIQAQPAEAQVLSPNTDKDIEKMGLPRPKEPNPGLGFPSLLLEGLPKFRAEAESGTLPEERAAPLAGFLPRPEVVALNPDPEPSESDKDPAALLAWLGGLRAFQSPIEFSQKVLASPLVKEAMALPIPSDIITRPFKPALMAKALGLSPAALFELTESLGQNPEESMSLENLLPLMGLSPAKAKESLNALSVHLVAGSLALPEELKGELRPKLKTKVSTIEDAAKLSATAPGLPQTEPKSPLNNMNEIDRSWVRAPSKTPVKRELLVPTQVPLAMEAIAGESRLISFDGPKASTLRGSETNFPLVTQNRSGAVEDFAGERFLDPRLEQQLEFVMAKGEKGKAPKAEFQSPFQLSGSEWSALFPGTKGAGKKAEPPSSAAPKIPELIGGFMPALPPHLSEATTPAKILSSEALVLEPSEKAEIYEQARFLVDRGGGSVSLDFGTPGLGEVRMQLDLNQQNQVELRLLTESSEARDAVFKELPSLKDNLWQHQVELKTVEVGIKATDNMGSMAQFNQNAFQRPQGQWQERLSLDKTQSKPQQTQKRMSYPARLSAIKPTMNQNGSIQILA